jgi:GT2 family glycosyltransferase
LREALPESAPGAPERPRFSVIILNWNGRHHLEECLESVQGQRFRDFETIVVDNGSTDGSQTWVKGRWGEEVALVELPENLGFSGGNNAGIRASRGRFVVLLNNDTAVDPGWLDALQQAAVRHPEAGMFTPKILNYYRRGEVDSTGLVIYPDGLARGRHRLEADDGRFDMEGEALCPSGCAGVYSRDMMDRIGLLDESFFAYGEDVDLGLRARWAGYTCFYVPEAVVYHRYSATTGEYSPLKVFLVERNRIWILVKNFPLALVVLSPVPTTIRYLLHLAAGIFGKGASGRFSGRFSLPVLIWTILKAVGAALVGLPNPVRQRRKLSRIANIDSSEFRILIRRHRLGVWEIVSKD